MYIWNLVWSELTSGQNQDLMESDKHRENKKCENVYIFLRLPWALEKFMFYGFLQCADSFLYICSYLPLRIIYGLFHTFSNPFNIRNIIKKLLEPSRMIDLCKLFLIFTCYLMLTFVDTSMVYHIIRGQAIIKLYIFFNMLEVADRLLSSIGQDILDALYWTATDPKKPKYFILPHLLLSLIYVFSHAMVILCQTTTLNVAFNSYNKALLTIMMSNNFVELKGSVFKKFDKFNLFQMSCSDVKERFHYLILLLMILIRNMSEFNWQFEQLCELIPIFLTIFFSEFFIDWIKHAFVLKFNDITPEVFNEFKMTLALDLIEGKQKTAAKDYSEVLNHRYGFIPIPLFCLLMRICVQAIKFTDFISYMNVFFAFVCLLFLKILNDVIMLGISCKWIKEERRMAKAEDLALEQSMISSSSLAEMHATRKRSENSSSNNNMVFVESIGATNLPSPIVNRQQSSNKTPRVSQSVDDTQETKSSTTTTTTATPIHESSSVSFKSSETQLEQQKEKKES